jgi:putative spermidine/putrescine transport system permease protein
MAAMSPVSGVGLVVDTPAPRGSLRGRRQRRLNIFRWIVFTVSGVFFILPLLSMVKFSFAGVAPGSFSLAAWTQIGSSPDLVAAIEITLELAVITTAVVLVLLVPTMIWVRLRVRWLSRAVEFLCLLPLTIPAIVLVVGLAPIYRSVRQHISLSALQLFWAYAILALPYAYRALSAGLETIDVPTLSEAARSLGASWFTVIVRVIAPNMWQAMLNAAVLTISLVLGEFTIASILLYTNLQVELYDISRATENASVLFSTSTAALLFTFILLFIISTVGRRRGRQRR